MVFTLTLHNKHHETIAKKLGEMPHVKVHTEHQAGVIVPVGGDGLKLAYAPGPEPHKISVMVTENPNCEEAGEIQSRLQSQIDEELLKQR